jgi:hypothetical protein
MLGTRELWEPEELVKKAGERRAIQLVGQRHGVRTGRQ